MAVDKAAAGSRMAVGIGNVGLDVENGRAIHQVGSTHVYHRPAGRVPLHMIETHRREADAVGTEWRARGKHPYPLVASQQGRAHHEAGSCMTIGRKMPQQPQVIKLLDATQGVTLAVTGLKSDCTRQLLDEATLLGNAKLRCKRRVKMGNSFQFHATILYKSDCRRGRTTRRWLADTAQNYHSFCKNERLGGLNFPVKTT